ncbi:nicotinamide-nucleotide adenylyltransferase [Haladaptatus sp. F3-133]|jgi:nicotinamide-nucleotide adenylyltransferase|uniref:Nicotinamide-nucleotide adenylyltransferase n=1 Tax=Halorutilus salinus TaxID=2487751 RepID=A0A9Q4GJK1_9EURY|nr:nicotinamide-nucleotide adenylyltransferase [Halorutilus salinus]MCX2819306.1 nicotinamide-nucleotide adenylyltransferase [Halorutilus salinus]
MRGLYVGRFQPFHKGHERVVDDIMDDVDEVVVAVGSAQKSHTLRNPFTAGERVSMITKALEDRDETVYAIPVEDLNRNAVWTTHVRSMCPPFETVYSNNPLIVRLFEEDDVEVRECVLFERDRFSGRVIRERMRDGGDWRALVPDEVEKVVDEVDGVRRLRDLDADDY